MQDEQLSWAIQDILVVKLEDPKLRVSVFFSMEKMGQVMLVESEKLGIKKTADLPRFVSPTELSGTLSNFCVEVMEEIKNRGNVG